MKCWKTLFNDAGLLTGTRAQNVKILSHVYFNKMAIIYKVLHLINNIGGYMAMNVYVS